jgi:hypothetical protein
MTTSLTPAMNLRIKLHAAHPDLSFDIVGKADTAYADDPTYNEELIGVVTQDMMIVDPYTSSCGRFTVLPEEAYGIPADVAADIRANNVKGA